MPTFCECARKLKISVNKAKTRAVMKVLLFRLTAKTEEMKMIRKKMPT